METPCPFGRWNRMLSIYILHTISFISFHLYLWVYHVDHTGWFFLLVLERLL
jgi:hypothetical protein